MKIIYLYFIAFTSGAATLAIEILAGRYMMPAFGSSLFIWAAVISVTLLCLALGYRWGGRLADRHQRPLQRLTTHGLLAAGWTGAIPLWGPLFLKIGMGTGPLWGPILVALGLFAVPIVLLSTVVPLGFGGAMRQNSTQPGGTMGDLFAISTAGSVLGALATGYVAVPVLGLSRTFFFVSLSLFLTLIPAALRGRGGGLTIVLLIFLITSHVLPNSWRGKGPFPQGVNVLFEKATRYAHLLVLEDDRDQSRVMLLDGASQNWVGGANWSESLFSYIPEILRHMERYRVNNGRALVLGLGAGTLVKELDRRGFDVKTVEIDPVVLNAARDYFDFPAAGPEVHIDDARAYLERYKNDAQKFDLIVVDVVGGGHHPEHIYNLDAFRLIKSRLSKTGLLVLNSVVFTQPPDNKVALHLISTIKSLFPHVEPIDLYPKEAKLGRLSGLLVLASEHPPVEPYSLWDRGVLLKVEETYRSLTDDWNPTALWSIEANARWHDNIRQWLGEPALIPN